MRMRKRSSSATASTVIRPWVNRTASLAAKYAADSTAGPKRRSGTAHGINCDVEMIRMQDINAAYERLLKSDVRYRFVIDLAWLKER